jgi:hypothetical protein
MGIKQVADLTQLNPSYPDALNPTRKAYHLVPVTVSRTNTTATKIAVLPADATVLGIRRYIQTASNAGTTATVTFTGQGVGPQGQAMTFGSDNVLVTTGNTGPITAPTVNTSTGIMNLERPPATQTSGDIIVYATYAETGTASTAGGPFIYVIEYVR